MRVERHEIEDYLDAGRGHGSANVLLFTCSEGEAVMIRGILAVANDRDGGCVIVGPVRETEAAAMALGLEGRVNDCVTPSLQLTIDQGEVDGGWYLFVQVRSVWGSEYPAICLGGCAGLKRMAIYELDRVGRCVREIQDDGAFRAMIRTACAIEAARANAMAYRVRELSLRFQGCR